MSLSKADKMKVAFNIMVTVAINVDQWRLLYNPLLGVVNTISAKVVLCKACVSYLVAAYHLRWQRTFANMLLDSSTQSAPLQ